jgi:4'-phosphopantetheinyl transferase
MPRVKNDFGSWDPHFPKQGLPTEDVSTKATNLSGSCPLTPPVPDLFSSTIHIWQFPVAIPEPEFIAFAELLSSEERDRASRFHFEKDARRFTVARATLRSILAGYTRVPAREISFLYSEHGKPSLANPATNIQFSVSHSGGFAMVAVAIGRKVGADIEAVREDIEIEKLAKRFFSTRECQDLLGLPQERRLATFFRYWTCKEAFLKAQGVGLSRGLGSFDVGLETGSAHLAATRPDLAEADLWSLHEVESSPGYAAAVAVEGGISAMQLFRYGARV